MSIHPLVYLQKPNFQVDLAEVHLSGLHAGSAGPGFESNLSPEIFHQYIGDYWN